MHTPPTYRCNLGAIGWNHDAWSGPFYPDDLPPEWRLAFYNTEFECTYLPYLVWSRETPETLAQWRNETQERFRFLLEPPHGENAPEDAARLAALGEQAVVASTPEDPKILWLEPDANLKHLAQSIQEQALTSPLYLISVGADYPQLEKTRTLLEILGY